MNNENFFQNTIEDEEFKKISITYDDVMKVQTPIEAFRMLNIHAKFMMDTQPEISRNEAIQKAKTNIAYHAAYYSDETRLRVETLYDCEHPIFGKFAQFGQPTSDEALELGIRMGQGNFKTLEQLRDEKFEKMKNER